MFDVVSKLLLHKQIIFEKGSFKIFGQSCSILPIQSHVDIQKKLEELGLINLIYYSNKVAGFKWFEVMKKAYGLKTKIDILKWGMSLMELAGFGESSYLKQDFDNFQIVVKIEQSPIVKLYGKSSTPVDVVYRGLLAGAMESTFNIPMDCIETKCSILEGSFCILDVRPTKDWNTSDENIRKQLEFPSLIIKTNIV